MNLNSKEIRNIYRQLQKLERNNREPIPDGKLEKLIETIYLSIEEERRDAAYYRALLEVAPDQFSADLLTEFAQDEREHAYQLQQAYERLTGKDYMQPQEEYEFDLEANDYEAALKKRILEETRDYKKYKNSYLMADHQYLRDIFFNALIDESYHALRELYLLQMIGMGMMDS